MTKPKPKRARTKKPPKRVLALPDLEQAKSAVLNSLASTSGQRTYDHAITEFVAWYCSEPRLAFNRAVVLRYRIRRVKGVRRIGVRMGKWLTAEHGRRLLERDGCSTSSTVCASLREPVCAGDSAPAFVESKHAVMWFPCL